MTSPSLDESLFVRTQGLRWFNPDWSGTIRRQKRCRMVIRTSQRVSINRPLAGFLTYTFTHQSMTVVAEGTTQEHRSCCVTVGTMPIRRRSYKTLAAGIDPFAACLATTDAKGTLLSRCSLGSLRRVSRNGSQLPENAVSVGQMPSRLKGRCYCP